MTLFFKWVFPTLFTSSSRHLLSLPRCGATVEGGTMATAPLDTSAKSSLREDLTCAICCDLFREPVMLACMHHFCKPCISRYWRGAHGPVTCPQCRMEFSSRQFQTNYLVAAMVEKVRASTSDCYFKNLEVSSQSLKTQDWICFHFHYSRRNKRFY